MGYCYCCGDVEEEYTSDGNPHEFSSKHKSNYILYVYKERKEALCGNRNGIFISCDVPRDPVKGENTPSFFTKESVERKVTISAIPKQKVKFLFNIRNEMNDHDMIFVGVQLAHPQKQFQMNDHPFVFGDDPYLLEKKSSVNQEISVTFQASDIGQFEMPIMFTFHREDTQKDLVIIREMVVVVDDTIAKYQRIWNPYTNEKWPKADYFVRTTLELINTDNFKIPKLLKILLPSPRCLDEAALDVFMEGKLKDELRLVQLDARNIFEEGVTESNYMRYFHYLLWWEEIVARINLRKYNMAKVTMERRPTPIGTIYVLEVPGLAEKRPSLMKGDKVFIRPCANKNVIFECAIKETEDNFIQLNGLDESFDVYFTPVALFDIRFIMSRVPLERMHEANARVFRTDHATRVFPQPRAGKAKIKRIDKFYNPLIPQNNEQRLAVEHIVAKASGLAPYMVFGPPGTGKTMTIVEAIVQLVSREPSHRVMVCTDSNMAADHIAVALLRYNKQLNINNYIFRANSQNRVWNVLPPALAEVSNGTCYKTFFPVNNAQLSMYRVVVTTLLHAAKFGTVRNQNMHKLQMSHLFIDEAAQALEPACLVPITGLLAPSGQLVLAGDPKQLGPVCISREAAKRGLNTSLMERLKLAYPNLYGNDPRVDHRYITMLVKNFRSDPAILALPNKLFYDGQLESLAKPDALSKVPILKGEKGGGEAVVFHGVNSQEQRVGKAPSYFNEKELQMVKRYITALILEHKVAPKDIGVITPYKRQVYKIDGWLKEQRYEDIEVGTVEAFQGKEKRVILISTVRANCKLLDYDEKYALGFIREPKRFNVALTRAKAKLIIIGNATCLVRDERWLEYTRHCRALGSYLGEDTEQVSRTEQLLHDISVTRFARCRLSKVMDEKDKEEQKKQPQQNGHETKKKKGKK